MNKNAKVVSVYGHSDMTLVEFRKNIVPRLIQLIKNANVFFVMSDEKKYASYTLSFLKAQGFVNYSIHKVSDRPMPQDSKIVYHETNIERLVELSKHQELSEMDE